MYTEVSKNRLMQVHLPVNPPLVTVTSCHKDAEYILLGKNRVCVCSAGFIPPTKFRSS
jgi:hypothetical protein